MQTIKVCKSTEAKHACLTDMFPSEVLAQYGVSVAATPEEADVIIASWMHELSPMVQKFGKTKRYLLWNSEPIWMAMEGSHTYPPIVYLTPDNLGQAVPVHVMTVSTRDVFTDNYFFFRCQAEEVEKTLAEKPVFDGKNRKVVAVVTYRNSPQFAYHFNDNFYSINNERCRVALDGYITGMVDIYGTGWPGGIAKGESRADALESKPALLKPYHFNLCSENTIVPNYVTEKIWESVANGCLPIYHAGKGHSVYADFPENSFIDVCDFKDTASLWEYVRKITPAEFYRRFQLCYDALQWALVRVNGERGKKALTNFRERLEIAVRPETKQLRSRLRFYALPTPDWRRILGKARPVILDVGANDGASSYVFHQTFPEGQIFSFEPDQRALERFRHRLVTVPSFTGHCRVFACAVGNIDGKVEFHQSGGKNPKTDMLKGDWDLSGSLCQPKEHLEKYPWCNFDNTVSVDCIRLDSWSKEIHKGLIDLIWADVQGAEGMMIEGARETLKRTRFLYTEYYNSEMYTGQLNLRQILELLPDFEVLADYGSDVLLVNKTLS